MLLIIGDAINFISLIAALIYGVYTLMSKKTPLFFQLIVCVIVCHILRYLFDICEFLVRGVFSGGYLIGYLGSIGCFLFLLTASFGYMDGIIDDKTEKMKKSRYIGLLAPAFAIVLLVINLLSDISGPTKLAYTALWIPAIFSSYFSLKHIVIPDMDFGFVKAIRPFNIAALAFTFLQLIHLTLWGVRNWILLLISGILFGASCIIMIVAADKGIKKWTL